MEKRNLQDVQSISPADIWENLSPEQQAQVVHLLAQMIYKLVPIRADVSTDEVSDGQRQGNVNESSEGFKNL